MKQTTCDTCHKSFAPNVQTTHVSSGAEIWHFTCPHCGQRYDVCHITRQGVELRRQLESVKAQIRLAPHDEGLETKRDDLLAKLEAEITDLTKAEVNQ